MLRERALGAEQPHALAESVLTHNIGASTTEAQRKFQSMSESQFGRLLAASYHARSTSPMSEVSGPR